MTDFIALSTKRERLLRQLEQTQHERLLTTAFSNYLKYHEDRRTAFKDAITDSNRTQDAALHECEEMLAAARFDAASGMAIDIERLAKYRYSIRKSIHETSKRNISLLTEAIPQDENDFNSELQRARTKVRAKALEYSEQADKIQERIAEHQAKSGPAQTHGRAEGLAAVQMKLLLLLDNLVPERDTAERTIGIPKARTPDISAKLQSAQEAIAHFDAVRSTVLSELDQKRAISKKSPMHVQKVQERLKMAASPRELLMSLTCQRKPFKTSTEVQTLACQIQNLEIQIENDELRGHLTEFRALSSTFCERYADLITRRTHETPLLADIALHDGIKPLESAKLWAAESLRRTEIKEAQHEDWLDKIRNRIDHSLELIETGNALVKEYNTAKTTETLAKVMHRA